MIQSPHLKSLLQTVLKDYPGLALNLRRLELSGKFEPVIHRWAKLKNAISELNDDSVDERETKKHASLFLDVLETEFKETIETSQDMMSKGVMTYEYLWTLFHPGSLVYARQDGQETTVKNTSCKYGVDRHGNPVFWVSGKYIDWDGTRFGTKVVNLMIPMYSGTRKIASLQACPLEYHPEKEALSKRLEERGTKLESLAGSHYRAYSGVGWKHSAFGGRDKYNIKGRICIDTYGWNRFVPNYAIYVTPLTAKDPDPVQDDDDESASGDEDNDDYDDDGGDEDDGGMPLDGHFLDEDDDSSKRIPLTTEQKMMCSPLIRGYSLKTKLWLNLYVNSVEDIEFNTESFKRLVLPQHQKELILGFTESQTEYKNFFDDVAYSGKGRGMILLLCGPPGVGKTLTAESVAEEMKIPLYSLSAGDLGLDPRNVENTLKDTLEMCTRWNAILLLDEADVFLEKRSLHELERNKLVSIFLRVLEYFEGIMFLTTNRVDTFDPAFQSRIHVSLDYPELSTESRRIIWKNFLDNSQQSHNITDRQLDHLSQLDVNGRQIKNILKTSQLLARKRDRPLSHDHIIQMLDMTQHLHNSNQDTERARSSIFC